MNVIARLEYELAYYDSAVHHFNHYTTGTPVYSLVMVISDSVSCWSFIFTLLTFTKTNFPFWDASSSVNDTFEILLIFPFLNMPTNILFCFFLFFSILSIYNKLLCVQPCYIHSIFVFEKQLLLKCLPSQLWQILGRGGGDIVFFNVLLWTEKGFLKVLLGVKKGRIFFS